MMELCHSYYHLPLRLWATRRYEWEEIQAMCKKVTGPFWLRVEGTLIPLEDEVSLALACKVSSAYHDWVAYNAPEDDGFRQEVEDIEAKLNCG